MNKGSIVERLCSDLDRKEPRYKWPTLLYFTLLPATESQQGGQLAERSPAPIMQETMKKVKYSGKTYVAALQKS